VDDEPAISASKEVANRTGLIIHDKVDERAYDKATIITNKLHTDIENLLLGLGIQRPQWNSPKLKEISQRLVLLCSTIVDGLVGPFITNNEHLDKSLQTPANECVEQTGKDDQPYPNGPAAGSGYLEAGR
jgi:hypothetical protein